MKNQSGATEVAFCGIQNRARQKRRWRTLVSVVVAGLLLPISSVIGQGCCINSRGNLDGSPDDAVSLGDLTLLIDHLFISLEAPGCWPEANVDGSIPEGTGSVTLSDLTVMVDHLFVSMTELTPCPPPLGPPWGSMVELGPCREPWKSTDAMRTGPPQVEQEQDCIYWEYDGYSRLTIYHLNAVFNCCPAEVIGDAWIAPGFILIEEYDTFDFEPCPCMCLHDLTYVFDNVSPGSFHVVIEEPYVFPSDPPVDTVIDIGTDPAGLYCVPRTTYPWDIGE